jgi:hypothetical protein
MTSGDEKTRFGAGMLFTSGTETGTTSTGIGGGASLVEGAGLLSSLRE